MSSFVVCCSCSSPLTPPRKQAALGWGGLRVGGSSGGVAGIAGPDLLGRRASALRGGVGARWSFVGGTRIVLRPGAAPGIVQFRGGFPAPTASGFMTSQIASTAFTWGTVAVLPFYTLMVVAPNAAYTKRIMESNTPYVMLGALYAYLLYLSWTPETIKLMFASKYWLPELSGIAKMFSNEMTLASAWIHLLAVDLFAARQVFHDGLKSKVETRHSVSLCLLFCPIGILIHVVTKLLTRAANRSH